MSQLDIGEVILQHVLQLENKLSELQASVAALGARMDIYEKGRDQEAARAAVPTVTNGRYRWLALLQNRGMRETVLFTLVVLALAGVHLDVVFQTLLQRFVPLGP